MQTTAGLHVQPGWDIYTRDGEHLGTAKETNDRCVVVQRGTLIKHDMFIPLSYIGEAEEDNRRAMLSLNKDDLDAFDWSHPPEP
jgi:hypothetical protein